MSREITEEEFVDGYMREAHGQTFEQLALAFLRWLEREGYIKVKRD